MGDKPYLILELDEHSAAAGVMTRLEAYKNVIENSMTRSQPKMQHQMITRSGFKTSDQVQGQGVRPIGKAQHTFVCEHLPESVLHPNL
jgi:hypothetical protein